MFVTLEVDTSVCDLIMSIETVYTYQISLPLPKITLQILLPWQLQSSYIVGLH